MNILKKIAIACGVVIILFIGLMVITFLNSPSKIKPESEQLIIPEEHIKSFDYNPETKVIYYTVEPKRHDFSRLILYKYNLETKERTTLDSLARYTPKPIFASKKGTVFLLDDRGNAFNSSSVILNPPELLEYGDKGRIHSYKIVNRLMAGNPASHTRTLVDCTDITNQFNDSTQFVGVYKGTDDKFYPYYAITRTESGETEAVFLEICKPESLAQFTPDTSPKFFSANLAHLNEASIREANGKKGVLYKEDAKNLVFESKEKTMMANFPCEKYYGALTWDGKTYDMGSCIQGINFAGSGYVFYGDTLLYNRVEGMYLLSNPSK